MFWSTFIYFAIVAVLLWIAGAYFAWKEKPKRAIFITLGGLLIFFIFIIGIWITLERPPLRTMGETRLWYSAFLPMVGLIVYARWRYKWILSFSTLLSAVFICVNLFHPEIQSKALMPALQSPWFAPHVIVYMFAYAILGAATLVAIYRLFRADARMSSIDDLVRVGLAFLTFGMLFGALWAKEAWGHYWAWDPKETWAVVTWFGYLVYIHYREMPKHRPRIALLWLLVCFCLLQMCWWGINYLPSATSSIHVY